MTFLHFLRSLDKNRKGILLMLVSAVCVAFGQLLWKISGGAVNAMLLTGFGLYGTGALIMIFAYRFGSLSVLHPFLSVGYVLSVILGALFLEEPVGYLKVIGVLCICIGVTLIGGGDE